MDAFSVGAMHPRSELSLATVESVFDGLPGIPFCVKDLALCYVSASSAMIELCGAATRADLLGKRASHFFPEATWRRQEAMDSLVLRTRTPIKEQLDLIMRVGSSPVWLLTSRWPLISHSGELAGLATVARILKAPSRKHPKYHRLSIVMEQLRANLGAPVDIAGLAQKAGVSTRQLKRDFSELFGLSPRRYVTKMRFEAALDLLKQGRPIADVAHACGYADQSAFTRRFRAATGLAPSEYRRTFLGVVAAQSDLEKPLR